jgi:DNA-binding transcriptional MerR regulator
MGTTDTSGTGYRIAELSRLTGFTPTTLRFYEDAGVLAPPRRTPAGYRAYDDRDVERLRLVARAKELGCTLDDIAGLVEAWDADECGPVKHRLRSLVDTKVADVRRHIGEQVAFAAQLEATAAGLADRPVDGPCDDTCGCSTSAVVATDAGKATGGDPAAIACSLGGGDMVARVEAWQALLAGVVRRQAVAGGLRLVFGPAAPVAEIAGLAAAEHDCCRFFAFALTIDDRGIALEVTAPDDGQVLLETVFGLVPR